MKICIWMTKIFDLGGTKRVVSLLANELVKEHDVTIMTYEDRFLEDRTMYHLSEEIDVQMGSWLLLFSLALHVGCLAS